MSQKLELTKQVSENICQKLMEGKPLTQICKDKDYPSLSTVYKWISQNREFANDIINSRRLGCQTYLDRMIEELELADNKNIMVIKEKLHHYRWLSSKLMPALYGDKQEIVQDTKITIEWSKPDDIKVIEAESQETETTKTISRASRSSSETELKE